MKAAVLRAFKAPLEIEEIEISKPGGREVLVRTAATGVCHSDLHAIDASLPIPLPCVLGHEPAGVVEAVGPEVQHVAPGDPVIGCLSVFCGSCEFCLNGAPNLCGGDATLRPPDQEPRLSKEGTALLQFAHLGAFAEQMLLHENAIVKIREDMPLDRAALIGCGVTAGLGAVFNSAQLKAGSTAVVIGLGGIGLAAVQGCRIAGASRIIAVDTMSWKLDLAKSLGATDVIDAAQGDPSQQVLELTQGGADYAFEAIGLPETVRQAFGSIKKGGLAVVLGILPLGADISIPGLDLVVSGKRLIGSMMGDNRFRVDMPRFVDLYLDGRLKLDEMISARMPLDRVNDAFDAMRRGSAARSVIVFDT